MIRYYNGDYGFPAGNMAGVGSANNLVAGSPSGIMPGAGPQLPLAMGGFQGGVPMGNAAFFPGGQLPQGFIGKTVV